KQNSTTVTFLQIQTGHEAWKAARKPWSWPFNLAIGWPKLSRTSTGPPTETASPLWGISRRSLGSPRSRGPWGPAGPVAPTGPAGPGAPATPGSPLSPFAPAGPGGPAGPRNQSQPPKLSVITKTKNNNIFCITQSSDFRDCVGSWSPSSFDDEDKMAKDQNLFDE